MSNPKVTITAGSNGVSRRRMLGAAAGTVAAGVGFAPIRRASAQDKITLKFQAGFGAKDIFFEVSQDWIKMVEEMSGGRVRIDFLPVGAVVPFTGIIEAVHTGTLDGGVAVPAYWFGKQVAFSLFGTGPSFGLDAEGLLGWIHYGGGQELYEELLKELKLDVVSFFWGPMPTQPFGWFKKGEIKKPEDLKGVKFRTVGLSADLYKQMGASVVILAGPDIIPALDRGVIDAAEFNNPTSDKILGFQDVSKVMMAQSYHQPVEFLETLINRKKWESLPKDIQAIVKYAATAASSNMTWKFMDQNSKDLAELKEKHKVRVVKTPKSVLDAQLKAWDTILEEKAKGNPFFTKVLDSQKKWAARVVPLRQEIMVDNEPAYAHYFKGKKQ